ncbi:hypothetical protein GRS80_10020 [Natrialba sp. INN-245]|nr:hypothetical protein [Natrialba sp. INN-245]
MGRGRSVATSQRSELVFVIALAVYRLLHPDARVRLTGGHEVAFDADEQHLPLEAGADGLLTGDYLTTGGQSAVADLDVVDRAGLEPNREVNAFDPDEIRARGATSSDDD